MHASMSGHEKGPGKKQRRGVGTSRWSAAWQGRGRRGRVCVWRRTCLSCNSALLRTSASASRVAIMQLLMAAASILGTSCRPGHTEVQELIASRQKGGYCKEDVCCCRRNCAPTRGWEPLAGIFWRGKDVGWSKEDQWLGVFQADYHSRPAQKTWGSRRRQRTTDNGPWHSDGLCQDHAKPAGLWK